MPPNLRLRSRHRGVGTNLRLGANNRHRPPIRIAFEMRLFPIRLTGEDGLAIAIAPQTLWASTWPTMQTMLTTLRLLSPEEIDVAPAPTESVDLVWQTVELGNLNSTNQPVKPQAVAISRNGEIYVVDTGVDVVQVYSPQGIHLSSLGEQGTEPGQFDFDRRARWPSTRAAICMWSTGQWARAETGYQRQSHLDDRRGGTELPRDAAVASDGEILVTDGDSGKIHVFDETGRPTKQIGIPVDEEQTPRPQGIAIGPEGHIYVTIPSMQRVLVLDESGQLLAELGQQNSETSTWAWPSGSCCGRRRECLCRRTASWARSSSFPPVESFWRCGRLEHIASCDAD